MLRNCLPIVWLASLLLAVGCATNPVTGRREIQMVSESREIEIGRQNYVPYQQMQGGTYVTDPAVAGYVREVAQKLWRVSDRPNLPYEIVVLNNSVPNAWAMPGGKMAINRGLLTELKSEAELAAVIGHETIHIAARHGAKGQERGMGLSALMLGVEVLTGDNRHQPAIVQGSGLLAGLTSLHYDRGAELQADRYGIAYMSRAGYDAQASVDIQEMFLKFSDDPGWVAGLLSSHPPSRERIETNQRTIQDYPIGGVVGRETYAQAMAGLLKSKPAYDKLDQGQQALAQNKPAQALSLAEAAIALEPREGHFYALAAKAHATQRAFPKALENMNEAIRRNGNYFEYYLDRGRLRYTMGDKQSARVDLEKSTTLLPTAQAHYLLGQMDMDSGRTSDAREHFRVAAAADSPESEKAAVLLAKLEIGDVPERYLQVGYGLDAKGYLNISIKNLSPVDVGTCEIGLSTAPTGRWKTFAFPNGVPARREASLVTGIGPFASAKEIQGAVQFRFERVVAAGVSATPAKLSRSQRGR
ncbi:MAG: M48 family metalloprotease [Verrucomicrobia bacterium]|nr:M48 family metalloprotease [Verrucomicrobiota bacterium]